MELARSGSLILPHRTCQQRPKQQPQRPRGACSSVVVPSGWSKQAACQPPADPLRSAARSQRCAGRCGRSSSSAVRAGDRRVVRRPPQRVDEDPDRARDRADALDFPTGHPVVDGPAAHVDEFARLPDRDSCPVGRHRFDRQYASLRHRDHARQTGTHRPAEHPRQGVSASRHRGYSDRARPSVPRVRRSGQQMRVLRNGNLPLDDAQLELRNPSTVGRVSLAAASCRPLPGHRLMQGASFSPR